MKYKFIFYTKNELGAAFNGFVYFSLEGAYKSSKRYMLAQHCISRGEVVESGPIDIDIDGVFALHIWAFGAHGGFRSFASNLVEDRWHLDKVIILSEENGGKYMCDFSNHTWGDGYIAEHDRMHSAPAVSLKGFCAILNITAPSKTTVRGYSFALNGVMLENAFFNDGDDVYIRVLDNDHGATLINKKNSEPFILQINSKASEETIDSIIAEIPQGKIIAIGGYNDGSNYQGIQNIRKKFGSQKISQLKDGSGWAWAMFASKDSKDSKDNIKIINEVVSLLGASGVSLSSEPIQNKSFESSKKRAENAIKYFISDPTHPYLQWVENIKKRLPLDDLSVVPIIVADVEEEHGEMVTRMIGGAVGLAQNSNIFYLPILRLIEHEYRSTSEYIKEEFPMFSSFDQSDIALIDELDVVVDEFFTLIDQFDHFIAMVRSPNDCGIVSLSKDSPMSKLYSELYNKFRRYIELKFVAQHLTRRVYLAIVADMAKKNNWLGTILVNMSFGYNLYKALKREYISYKIFDIFDITRLGFKVDPDSLYELIYKGGSTDIQQAKEKLRNDLKLYANILVISASGNEYLQAKNEFGDPKFSECEISDIDEIIKVGSVDIEAKIASFSPADKDVLVCAPGVDIPLEELKDPDHQKFYSSTYWYSPGSARFLENTQGTSFSAPFVASVAARMIAANTQLTPKDIRMIFNSDQSVNIVKDNDGRSCRSLDPERSIQFSKSFRPKLRLLNQIEVENIKEDIIEALIEALEHLEVQIRVTAATALMQLNKESQDVISVLIKAMDYLNVTCDIRKQAISTLGRSKHITPQLVSALIKASGVWFGVTVSQEPIFALVQLGKTSPDVVITTLIQELNNKNYNIKEEVKLTLVKLGKESPKKVIAALTKALMDNDLEVRKQALSVFTELGNESSEAISALIILLEDLDPDVRKLAASALENGKQPASDDIIFALFKGLKGNDSFYSPLERVLLRCKQMTPDLIPILIKALENWHSGIRSSAAFALRHCKKINLEVIPALIKALTDRNLNVQSRAASTLVQLGNESSEILSILVKALEKNDYVDGSTQEDAAFTLGYCKQITPEVVSALIKALGYINTSDQAASAISMIIQLSNKKLREEVVAALFKVFADGSGLSKRRGQAAIILGNCEHPTLKIVLSLTKALGDHSLESEARMKVISVLARLVNNDLFQREVTTALIKALEDHSSRVRMEALHALISCKQPEPDVIAVMIKLVKANPNCPHDNRSAADALGNWKQATPDAIAALIETMRDNWWGNGRAPFVLGQLGQEFPVVISMLMKALKDMNSDLRSRSAFALGKCKQTSPDIISALLKALEDLDRGVRRNAVSALLDLHQTSPDIISALIKTLEDSDPGVREAAVSALLDLKQTSPDVISALVKVLQDPYIKMKSASALEQLSEKCSGVISELIKAMESSNPHTKMMSAYVLGKCKQTSSDIIFALIKALKDSDMRTQAAFALASLASGLNQQLDSLFKFLKEKDNLEYKNWGVLTNREITKCMFKFFDSKTLNRLSCVSKGYNSLQQKKEQKYSPPSRILTHLSTSQSLLFRPLQPVLDEKETTGVIAPNPRLPDEKKGDQLTSSQVRLSDRLSVPKDIKSITTTLTELNSLPAQPMPKTRIAPIREGKINIDSVPSSLQKSLLNKSFSRK